MTTVDPYSRVREGISPHLKYAVEPMHLRHVPAVGAIERLSFTTVWPESAYRREIQRNEMAHYLIARRLPSVSIRRAQPRFVADQPLEVHENESLIGRINRIIRGAPTTMNREAAEELESVVGYVGMWLMFDEAHVTTIAVDPEYRGEGVGELLLVWVIDRALYLGAAEMTLECRMSNEVAQALYRKYTFRDAGVRKRYYSDDGEDALIMTTERLDSDNFQTVFEANRERLNERLRTG